MGIVRRTPVPLTTVRRHCLVAYLRACQHYILDAEISPYSSARVQAQYINYHSSCAMRALRRLADV